MRRALLLASLATLPAAAPDDGWQAYTAGRYTEAVTRWTQEAVTGDAQAQLGLALAYDLGQGVTPDAASACLWYRRAGEAGVAAAAFNYAVMLDQGRCGARDPQAAAIWYGRAAAAGHARAEYDLAQLYEAGDGVPRNLDQAAAWYRLASSNGLSAASAKASALSNRPRVASDTGLLPVQALTPVDESLPDRGQPTTFVWSAPPQSAPVRFFLEVDALAADGAQEVAARYADQSAVTVALQPGASYYAWRVLTVSTEDRHYVASPWWRFQVAGRPAR